MSVEQAYVYIMASQSRTIYVGVTTDLERRVWEHKTHFREGFTKQYNVTKLVYIAEFARLDEAIAWEKALKGKTRANWYDDGAPPTALSASRGGSSLRSE